MPKIVAAEEPQQAQQGLQPYWQSACGRYRVYVGDCREVLKQLTDQFDSVVTDPPYGLEFMGKDWDAPWKANGSDLNSTI